MPEQVKNKLLIVDDSIIARMSVRKIVEESGYSVIEAANGQEAIEILKTETPDCILLDYLMPGLNGLIVLKLIRAKGIDIPVIIISANQQEATIRKFYDIGISGFMKKHPDKKEMLHLIETAIRVRGGKK